VSGGDQLIAADTNVKHNLFKLSDEKTFDYSAFESQLSQFETDLKIYSQSNQKNIKTAIKVPKWSAVSKTSPGSDQPKK
jgi:uncharacterized membrane protein